ncbi:MAG: hypothetical protein II907_01525 [Firmicutes bacterium]|nr:hypothetical protein [Bacillota bacterium]
MSKTDEEKQAIKEAKEAAKAAKAKETQQKQEAKRAKQQEAKKKVLEVLGDAKDVVEAKADDAVGAMKKAGALAAQKAGEVSLDVQRQMLNPVFDDELRSSSMPDMIRICSPDKQHLDSPACKNSVGHMLVVKDLKVLNLYPAYKDDYELEFYPSSQEDVYYRHPFIPNRYVSFDSYFNQIKKEKVDELERIASALGAKSVEIKLYAHKKTFTGVKGTAGAVAGTKGKGKDKKAKAEASVEAGFDSTSYEEIGVKSVAKFKGHAPEVPALHYFSNDSDILTLIENRLGKNDFIEKSYKIEYKNSSQINAALAMKIDAALKKMKLIDANATISGQVEEESRMAFEYHIKFPQRTRSKRLKEE